MNEYLNWRYATEKFDSSKKLSASDLSEILESLRLSPSSFGLQPWKFVIVKDQSLRQEIMKHSKNQPQVVDASELIILCALKKMDATYIKSHVVQIAKLRCVPEESLVRYEASLIKFVKSLKQSDLSIWMRYQVYIALGIFLSACAQKRIDACPMEGFNSIKVDEILGLSKEGIESVVLCPVGYRSQDDKYASLAKVRFSPSQVFIQK